MKLNSPYDTKSKCFLLIRDDMRFTIEFCPRLSQWFIMCAILPVEDMRKMSKLIAFLTCNKRDFIGSGRYDKMT